MNRVARLASASLLLLAGCGGRADQQSAAADNFTPPDTQPPTPLPGQRQTTPLTAYAGHHPQDAVDGVGFFDRTEVADALIDLEPDEGVRRMITGRDVTTAPIFAADGRVAAYGCEPQDCGGHNWTLLIAADGDEDRAALCLHDAASMGGTSRWSARAAVTRRPGDCPSG